MDMEVKSALTAVTVKVVDAEDGGRGGEDNATANEK
jgi:hypothetical protein